MFETTESAHEARGSKQILLEVGLIALALAVLGGIIYFFAFTGVVK